MIHDKVSMAIPELEAFFHGHSHQLCNNVRSGIIAMDLVPKGALKAMLEPLHPLWSRSSRIHMICSVTTCYVTPTYVSADS